MEEVNALILSYLKSMGLVKSHKVLLKELASMGSTVACADGDAGVKGRQVDLRVIVQAWNKKKGGSSDSSSDSSSSESDDSSSSESDGSSSSSSDSSSGESDGSSSSDSSSDSSSSSDESEDEKPCLKRKQPVSPPPTPAVVKKSKPEKKSLEKKFEKPEKEQKQEAPKRFSRINREEVEFLDERVKDNRFEAKGGAVPGSYGFKAHLDLSVTRGKGFTKEKNKKKRGSYRGGQIDMGSHSIKFGSDSE